MRTTDLDPRDLELPGLVMHDGFDLVHCDSNVFNLSMISMAIEDGSGCAQGACNPDSTRCHDYGYTKARETADHVP